MEETGENNEEQNQRKSLGAFQRKEKGKNSTVHCKSQLD